MQFTQHNAYEGKWRAKYRMEGIKRGDKSKEVGRLLGLLHTQAKGCDHEIVRAQKKVPKGCPKTPPKSCSVVTDLWV